jgi:hypothetical protein
MPNGWSMIRHRQPQCSSQARTFGFGVLSLAALLGAAVSHFAIDAAGDFVLTHDTYDHIAHHSRFIALFFAGLAAASTVLLLVGAAMKDARTGGAAVRSLVGFYARRTRWLLVGAIAPASLVALVAMESIDGWLDLGRLPTFADALGGSIALGLGISILAAYVVGEALWRALRFVDESHRAISSTLGRLLTMRDASSTSHPISRTYLPGEDARSRASVLASRAGKRAPPLPA